MLVVFMLSAEFYIVLLKIFIVVLSLVMDYIVLLSVNYVEPLVNIVLLIFIMLSVVFNIIRLSSVMLSVIIHTGYRNFHCFTQFNFAKCHIFYCYAEFGDAECCLAEFLVYYSILSNYIVTFLLLC
jgi:hypothetical protein